MRYLTTTLIVGSLLAVLIPCEAFAQRGVGQTVGVARQGTPRTLESVTGTVSEIKIGPCEATTGRSLTGMHVLLTADDGTTYNVHLGPLQSVRDLLGDVEVGDTLAVDGFRTARLDDDALVASSVTRDGQTVALRQASLQPQWAASASRGQGQGRGMGQGQGRGKGRGQGQGQGRGQAQAAATFTRPANCPAQWQPGMGRGQGNGRAAMQGNGNGYRGNGRGMGQGRGNAAFGGNSTQGYCMQQITASLQGIPAGDLTAEDREGLMLMREEEKLAHDVYVTLGATWNIQPFANIPWAETQHMQAMKLLLDRYGLQDPMTDSTVGVFQNPELQQLYDSLVSRGQQSLVEACKVGTLIEELDIADLEGLKQATDNADLQMVYDNLIRGSRNHLRAFARQLQRSGATYTAEHLTQAEFDRIAAGPHEPGWATISPMP